MVSQSTAQKFVNALEENSYQYDFEVRPNYQGRGMYNRSCVGITTGHGAFSTAVDMLEIINNMTDITDNERSELEEAIKNASSDNMALDYIYYFKSISLDEPTEDDEV